MDSPSAWLKNARSDLVLAKMKLPPGGMYEHLCFHAQQTAEKSLKAVLLALRMDFPFTHNIQILLNALSETIDVPKELLLASKLTSYATTIRYPGNAEPVSESDYRYALELAEPVFQWAEETVETLGSAPIEASPTSELPPGG